MGRRTLGRIGDRIGARIATGNYTGDGTTSQAITGIGFAVKYVHIWSQPTTSDAAAATHAETTDDAVDDNANGFSVHTASAGAVEWRDNAIISLDADGFTVDDDGADGPPNTDGITYKYLALG